MTTLTSREADAKRKLVEATKSIRTKLNNIQMLMVTITIMTMAMSLSVLITILDRFSQLWATGPLPSIMTS